MKNTYILFLLLGFELVFGNLLFGQEVLSVRSNMEGLHVGVDLSQKSWSSEYFTQLDELEPRGFGGALLLGYGLDQHWEIKGSFDFHDFGLNNNWDKYQFKALSAGLAYNFGGSLQAFRPFLGGGLSYQLLEVAPVYLDNYPVTYKLTGLMPYVDGGLGYFIKPHFSLNLAAQLAFGKFSKFNIDTSPIGDKPDASTFKIALGAKYYFN